MNKRKRTKLPGFIAGALAVSLLIYACTHDDFLPGLKKDDVSKKNRELTAEYARLWTVSNSGRLTGINNKNHHTKSFSLNEGQQTSSVCCLPPVLGSAILYR
ncbi:MAG: hypothetical protein AB2L24_15560 [Mangrovibacterium sp.]